jgi:hypothetical protein
MTLKSLIQRLLDSRTTPEEAGHSAMPDYSTMTTFASGLSGTGTIYKGVAPSDGFLYVRARHAENSSHLNIDTEGKWVTCPSPFKGSLSGMMKPVTKGQSFTLAGNSISEVVVGFITAIGGGYNRFVWRALSCLKPSFNYLSRSFCKAKGLGSQSSALLLPAVAHSFPVQAQRISLPTSLRATAGRHLGATQTPSQLSKFKSGMDRWCLPQFLMETLRDVVSAVTLKKEAPLSSYVEAATRRIIPFGSTGQVPTLNSLTGGALC